MRPILIGTILQLVSPSDQEGSDCASLGFDQQGKNSRYNIVVKSFQFWNATLAKNYPILALK